MRKAYRKLFNIMFLGFSVVALTLCLTVTFAFFTDNLTLSINVQVGQISVAVNVKGKSYTSDNSYSYAVLNSDTGMPGDNLTGNVRIVPTFNLADGNGIYARIKVSSTITPTNACSLEINNNSNWELNLTGHDTGYYYYTGGEGTLKAITTSGDEIDFSTGVVVPASVTNQNIKITLSITAETTQVGYQESSLVWNNNNNLFINGDGSFGDITNWEGDSNKNLTYTVDETSPSGTAFTHSYVGTSGRTIKAGNFAPVDITQSYEISAYAKDTHGTNTYFLGLVQYDIDKLEILPKYALWVNGSTTKLARDIKNGDTVIYLEDVSGFLDYSQLFYRMGFIIWDYKDSTGYQYPKETYSRNVVVGTKDQYLFDYEDIDFANNCINLNYAWDGDSHTAGTDISQSADGGTFMYCLLSSKSMTTSWTQYTATISGYQINSTNNTQFRQGTKYVNLLMVCNANASNTSSVTTSLTNISIRKI